MELGNKMKKLLIVAMCVITACTSAQEDRVIELGNKAITEMELCLKDGPANDFQMDECNQSKLFAEYKAEKAKLTSISSEVAEVDRKKNQLTGKLMGAVMDNAIESACKSVPNNTSPHCPH